MKLTLSPIIEKIRKAFKRARSCDNCPFTSNEDPLTNKLFKCSDDKKMYQYICAASDSNDRDTLVVVYKDINTGLFYNKKWNLFFSTVEKDGNCIPRFEEQA